MALRDLFRRRKAEETVQEPQMVGMDEMLRENGGPGSVRPGYQQVQMGEPAVRNGAEEEAFQLGQQIGAESNLREQGAEGVYLGGNGNENRNVVTKEMLLRAKQDLLTYRSGKYSVERRVINAQNWWKLRNAEMQEVERGAKGPEAIQTSTLWLWSAVVNAHAKLNDNIPEPIFLPREENDKAEAQKLTDVIPVIMKINRFADVFSDLLWQILIEGSLVSGTFWDKEKCHGLGDVSIKKVSILNLFWEPGINKLEESKQIFYTYLMDNDELLADYPQLQGKIGTEAYLQAEYDTDDTVPKEDKSVVVDWYYKKRVNGRTVLHLCTWCADEILFSTENAGMVDGLYDDGEFPFDMLPLYPVEGSPAGYGMIDIGKDVQMDIDIMNRGMVLNSLMASLPRHFIKKDGSVNEQEFADLTKMFIHVGGSLGEESIRKVDIPQMPGHVMNVYNGKIDEMKYATGNTDVSNGSVPNGVTAASAIAALQEEQGKGMKDITAMIYSWFENVSDKIVSRTRQGYTVARTFRITGKGGEDETFVPFDNSGLKPQPLPEGMGLEGNMRMPVFDIDIRAQRESVYTRMSNNELAIQLHDKGFFNPQNTDQALMTLELMDFKGRDEVMSMIRKNGTLFDAYVKISQVALALAQKYDPAMADQLAQITQGVAGMATNQPMMTGGQQPMKLPEAEKTDSAEEENRTNAMVNRARERTANATRPE